MEGGPGGQIVSIKREDEGREAERSLMKRVKSTKPRTDPCITARRRSQPGFVNLIRNGPRKEQNLIETRPSKAKTSLAGRENGVRL